MQSEAPPSPRIERITLKDIGPFDGASFAPLPPTGPGELVLFEGPNGSGKTTILEAIAALIGSPFGPLSQGASAAPVYHFSAGLALIAPSSRSISPANAAQGQA